MSEKEKQIMENIAKALPQMSEFEKGRMLGVAETIAEQNKKEKKEKELVLND